MGPAPMASAMHIAMHPETVYGYSLTVLAALTIGLAVLGACVVEGCARRFVPLELRRAHIDVAAPMLGTIGTTYAVLLAFVAMLAWDSFNRAGAASQDEAAAIAGVALAFDGLSATDAAPLRAALVAYTRGVVDDDWPAQASGGVPARMSPAIEQLDALAAALHPATPAQTNIQARLLAAVSHLADARVTRLHLATTTLPGIIWTTLLLGGGLTIAAASFVAAPSLRVHLLMSSALAVSGALVLVLIVALSNPFRGTFRVPDTPYAEVLEALLAPAVR